MITLSELTYFIRSGANEQLAAALDAEPALAEGRLEQGFSLLQFAAYCRNAVAADLIRQRKTAPPDLFEAACIGDGEALHRHIAEHPALVNTFSGDGFTALGLACFFGHLDEVKFLLEHDADVNLPANNSLRVAPLHSACAIAHYPMAELLLRNGADVNARQQADVTPLHEAAHLGQTALARLLLEYGADPQARRDDNGQTPLDMAEADGFPETAALIREWGKPTKN